MKQFKIQYLLFLVVAFLAVSCTKNFEQVNTDPERPHQITPGVMLGQLQYKLVNRSIVEGRYFTHEVMQVDAPRSSTSGIGLHRYVVTQDMANAWSAFYLGMVDVDDIYKMANDLGEVNYKAIALVYKCWAYSILTDVYGDIPYSQATTAAKGNFQASFDKQKDIYVKMLADLDTANLLFNTTKALTYGGDVVYNANTVSGGVNAGLVKWKKFCNSLKLRLLLRIIKRDGEINVSSQINAILANPTLYPVFTNNADEAIFRYPNTVPYFNPFYTARQVDWRDGNYFTKFFINKMNTDNDPRRSVWCTQVLVSGNNVYQGIESGYPTSLQYVVGKNSSYSDGLKNLSQLGVMMSYAEVEFAKAELALKGFATGKSPQKHYEEGIGASMIQWGVTLPAGYLTQPGVLYNSAATADKQLEQIMLQKYYAYFFTDYQSWFEKRRTGYPILPRGSGIPAENIFPFRVPYPSYLQSLNAANLAAAITSMGGDNSNIKVWWDK